MPRPAPPPTQAPRAEPIEHPAPNMPSLGMHVATLNLFREADGTMWMTVASAPEAVREAQRRQAANPSVPVYPMQIMAGWVREAAQRFVSSWINHHPPHAGQ